MDGEPGEMEMGWGSGFGATNTNCTFQPESCMCVCWPQLLFSKASVWVKSKNHNKITCLSWNLPRFCFFSVAPNLFLLFAAFADAKRFAILFRLSRPSKGEEECKVFMCSWGCFFKLFRFFCVYIIWIYSRWAAFRYVKSFAWHWVRLHAKKYLI